MTRILMTASLIAAATPALSIEPHPNSLAAQMARPWRHASGPVTTQRFETDKARCATIAQVTPAGAGSTEIKFLATFISCMKAEGYTN